MKTALQQLEIMEREALVIEKQQGRSRELLLIRCIITFLKLHIKQDQQTKEARSDERRERRTAQREV